MVSTFELQNGIRVCMEEISFVRSISFGIWVRTGSKDENISQNGTSHFIEHMLFKGTKARTAKLIASEMDAIGGQLNAFTSKEYTCFYLRILDQHFDIALDIIADMFLNSLFTEEDIEKERKVISEEINMYNDSPEELVGDILQQNIWGNSLGFPILGTKETISTFNHNLLTEYMNKHYVAGDIVLSIAGNFQSSVMEKKLSSYFTLLEKKPGNKNFDESTNFKQGIFVKEKQIEQLHFNLGFKSLEIASEDAHVLSVINAIVGGGMSSYLFQKLREENGLVYSVYSYNSSFIRTGIFLIYMALNKEKAEGAIELVIQTINDFKKNPFSKAELETTKEHLKSNFILGMESSISRMNSIGKNMLMANKIVEPDEVIKKIDAVTSEDIKRVSGQIFDFNFFAFSAVGKTNDINFGKIFEKQGVSLGD